MTQPCPFVHRLEHVRRVARAAVGDRHHHDRQRERRHRHLPLADRDRDRLARRTTSRCSAAASTRVDGTSPCTSFGRSMPVFSPSPSAAPTCGSGRRRACCRRCRSTRCRTARSRGAGRRCRGRPSSSTGSSGRRRSRRRAQWTLKSGVMTPSCEPGGRDRNLERRSRRVAALQRAVLQRLQLVGVERRPGRAVDAAGERVRIVGRQARRATSTSPLRGSSMTAAPLKPAA